MKACLFQNPWQFFPRLVTKRSVHPKKHCSHLLEEIQNFSWKEPLLNHTRSHSNNLLTSSET
jgi:hypothetical protein